MNKKKRNLYIIIGVAAAVGYYMWTQKKKNSKLGKPAGTGSFDTKKTAEAIKSSMQGAGALGGTDEALFFSTARALTQPKRDSVRHYFDANLGEGETLCEWIEGDFSAEMEDKAKALFSC